MTNEVAEVAALHLSALFPEAELAAAIADGFVREQFHPSLPLRILNYTERTQYERAWSEVTRQCRGLIVHAQTGEIVARPFPKFFNYGEHDEAALSLDEFVTITDKMDGSLGIMYPDPGQPTGYAIATRGSFMSEQAQHATELLNSGRYNLPNIWFPGEGFTALFEIVYPGNRIVLDYGGMDELVYLGVVHIESGDSQGPAIGCGWEYADGSTGPMAAVFEGHTLGDALSMEPRRNAEGIVVHYNRSGLRIKLKQADYVELHKLITGMNARVVWERIGEGETAEQICAGIPEEFWPWIREVGGDLIREKNRIIDEATAEHERVLTGLPEGWTRKDYAMAAVKSPLRAWLFMLLDGKDPSAKIWRTLRPSGERALVAHGEDVA